MSEENYYGEALRASKCHGLWIGPAPTLQTKDGDDSILVVGATPALIMGGRVLPAFAFETEIAPGSIATINTNSRYYLYAYASSGLLTYAIFSTPPDASRTFHSTDSAYRFIGTFRTDDSGDIVPFSASSDGEYVYDFSSNPAYFRSKSVGVDGSHTMIPLVDSVSMTVSLLPPYARQARVRASALATGTNQDAALIYSSNSVSGGFQLNTAVSSSVVYAVENFNIKTDASQRIGYAVSAPSRISLTLWTLGFK